MWYAVLMAQRKKKPKQRPAATKEAATHPKDRDVPQPEPEPEASAPPPRSPGVPSPDQEHPYAALLFIGVIMGLIALAVIAQLFLG